MTYYLKRIFFLFLICVLFLGHLSAQSRPSTAIYLDSTKTDTDESVVIVRKHSPKVAMYLSAVIPGAGQVFNGKYWKVPLIYAGFAFGISCHISYNSSYKTYQNLYKIYSDSITKNPNAILQINYNGNKYPASSILEARDRMRKNRDLTTICLSAWYILNIVDACVDAYLFEYDMSDNLSVNIKPNFFYLDKNRYSTGISLRFYAKR